jgi:hypothetical protein
MSNVHEEYEDETGESAGKDPVRSHLRKVEQGKQTASPTGCGVRDLETRNGFYQSGH